MRPTKHELGLELALLTAQRSTCLRRKVGCVLTNAHGHVMATGYNGVAAGLPHCNHHDPFYDVGYPYACSGAWSKSGTNLDGCEAIHAEQNALLQCRNVYEIDTCYVTVSPCVTCCKLLLNTSCKRIIFLEEYVHTEAKDLWLRGQRYWLQIERWKAGTDAGKNARTPPVEPVS